MALPSIEEGPMDPKDNGKRRALVWASGAALVSTVCVAGFAVHGAATAWASPMELASSAPAWGSGASSHAIIGGLGGAEAAAVALAGGAKGGDPIDLAAMPVMAEHDDLSEEYSNLKKWATKLHAGTKNFDNLLKNGPLSPPRSHKGSSDDAHVSDHALGDLHIMRSASQMMAANQASAIRKGAAALSSPKPTAHEKHVFPQPHESKKILDKESKIDAAEKRLRAKMAKEEEAY